jgi:hypothetical protein
MPRLFDFGSPIGSSSGILIAAYTEDFFASDGAL